jgi:hypothetical protein
MPGPENGGRRWSWCSVWSSEPRREGRRREDNACLGTEPVARRFAVLGAPVGRRGRSGT